MYHKSRTFSHADQMDTLEFWPVTATASNLIFRFYATTRQWVQAQTEFEGRTQWFHNSSPEGREKMRARKREGERDYNQGTKNESRQRNEGGR